MESGFPNCDGRRSREWESTERQNMNIAAAEATDTKGAEKMPDPRKPVKYGDLSRRMPERWEVRSPSRPAGEAHASVFFHMG